MEMESVVCMKNVNDEVIAVLQAHLADIDGAPRDVKADITGSSDLRRMLCRIMEHYMKTDQ